MTKTNTKHIRVARILVTVSEDYMTCHGENTIEEGWEDVTEELEKFLARFPSDGDKVSLIEWEGDEALDTTIEVST